MSVELHLPDLPEVPIALGPARGAPRRPHVRWHLWLRELLSAYLPLLLMSLLALFTWWLVKVTPSPPGTREELPVRHAPDYTMSEFALERFDAAGRLKVRIEGERMRHFPDTDRIEVDRVQIRAVAPDGRVTLASAQRAISNGDASEVQLLGGAQVTSTDAAGAKLQMSGEFLQAFLVTERVSSPLPVQVSMDGSSLRAGGLDYDHGKGRLDLQAPIHAVFPPGGRK
jgi:lipopolysaccharide export system protein LptC